MCQLHSVSYSILIVSRQNSYIYPYFMGKKTNEFVHLYAAIKC